MLTEAYADDLTILFKWDRAGLKRIIQILALNFREQLMNDQGARQDQKTETKRLTHTQQ